MLNPIFGRGKTIANVMREGSSQAGSVTNAWLFAKKPLPLVLLVVVLAAIGACLYGLERKGALVASLNRQLSLERSRTDYWRRLASQREAALTKLHSAIGSSPVMQTASPAQANPASFPSIGPDTLYQNGKPLGSASAIQVMQGEKIVIFGEVQVTTKFNINADFQFGPYLLHYMPNPLPPGTPGGALNEVVSFEATKISVMDNLYARIVRKLK